MKFMGVKKLLDDIEALNMLVVFAVTRALKTNKRFKANDMDESASDNELEYFNFEDCLIEEDPDSE